MFLLEKVKLQFIGEIRYPYFSCFGKKSTKISRPKGRYEPIAPPLGIPRRIAIQHSKMFRFLNAYIQQICKTASQSPLKIGTFSVGGGRCGGSGGRGEDAIGS